jgi:hypothetical protein
MFASVHLIAFSIAIMKLIEANINLILILNFAYHPKYPDFLRFLLYAIDIKGISFFKLKIIFSFLCLIRVWLLA